MNIKTPLAAALAVALLAGAAVAQNAPPPPQPQAPPSEPGRSPPPPPPGRGPESRGPEGRPFDMRAEGPGRGFGHGFGPHMGGPGPMPSKGAFLRYDKNGGITLKCADEDTTKACLEAAGPILEKLASQPR